MSKSNNSMRLLLMVAAVIAIAVGIYTQQASEKTKALPQLNKAVILPNTKPLDHVNFIDHRGNNFSADSLKGYWNILFFGFTNCPDICPTTMRTLAQVKQSLSKDDTWGNYRVIMVSVDPERDTQERLNNYVPYFDDEFIGIRSDVETTTKFAKQLGILFVKQKAEDGFYQVDHGASIILVNPKGELAGIITAPHQQDEISNDLALLAEYFADDHLQSTINTPLSEQSFQHASNESHVLATNLTANSNSSEGIAGLIISEAWIRPAPPTANSMAGYFKLKNVTDSDINLMAVESQSFTMAMIHDTIIEDDIARMQHLNQLTIPAQSEVALAPLGMHLMLMNPLQPLGLGDSASITLISQNGSRLTKSIQVKQPPEN